MENRFFVTYDMLKGAPTNIKFKQGNIDTAVLEVAITDNKLVTDLTGETIEFRFAKPDGTGVFQDSTAGVNIIDAAGGKVECVLKSNTLAATGWVKCEIHRSKEGKVLKMPTFTFLVEKSVGKGEISTNYIGRIEDYILQYKQLKIDTEEAIINTNAAATLADEKAALAQTAADNANSAVTNINNNTLIIYKPYVATYADIVTKYPVPELGWTTQALDAHTRYRWNGTEWENIGVFQDDKIGDLSVINETDLVKAIQADRSQLADIVQLMPYGELKLPSDMPITFPFKLRRDIDNVMRHNADFSQFTTGGVEYFVDTDLGVDTNDGLTIGTAFKTLGKAISTSINSVVLGLFKIKIKGYVTNGDGMLNSDGIRWVVPTNKKIAISSYDSNKVYISTGAKKESYIGKWAVKNGLNFLNVLDKEFTAVYDANNLDAYGIMTPLKRVKTLAECQSTVNTFYAIPIAKGGGVYVNCANSNIVNLYDTYLGTTGTWLSETTGVESSSGFPTATSPFMPVIGGHSYTLVNGATPATVACWYDASYTFISSVRLTDGALNNKPCVMTAPANAKYAKVVVFPNNYASWHDLVKFYDNETVANLLPLYGQLVTDTTYKYGSNLAFSLLSNAKLYFENIVFLSGDTSNVDELFKAGALACEGTYEALNKNEVWLKNCIIIGGQTGGIDASGYYNNTCDSVAGLLTRETSCFTFNCICAYNGTDALSYGANPTYINHIAFEYQNVAYDTLGGATANSSTCHNFFNRLSVGCIYSNATGGVIADANGCYSLCIDCHCKNASYNNPNPARAMSLFHSDLPQANADAWGRRGKMILINCSAYGSGYSALDADGVIDTYIFNFSTNKQITSDIAMQKYVFEF